MHSDLSLDFESIFKSTENSISSIKRQLGNKGRSHAVSRSPVESGSISFNASPQTDSFNKIRAAYSQSPSQTTVITSVLKRMEEQSKTIALLETVIQTQNEDMEMLKQKQNDMEKTLRAYSNVSLQRKIESIERKVDEDIASLWSALRSNSHTRNERGLDISARNSLSRDIELQRQLVEDELESIRREVDNVKSKIGRIETDMGISLREAGDVNRKYGAIERDVIDIIENQRNMRRVTKKGENQLLGIKRELEDISSILSNLCCKNSSATEKVGSRKYNHMIKDNCNPEWDKSESEGDLSIADSPILTALLLTSENEDTEQDSLLLNNSLKIDISDEDNDDILELDNSSNLSLECLQLSDELLSTLQLS